MKMGLLDRVKYDPRINVGSFEDRQKDLTSHFVMLACLGWDLVPISTALRHIKVCMKKRYGSYTRCLCLRKMRDRAIYDPRINAVHFED